MNVPRQSPRKLTYADYVLFPDDGRRHEIIEGEHHVNPAPGTGHQTVSRHIQFQLYSQLEQAGIALVFDAPTDLQLSDSDVVQPDLIVVATAKRFIITPTKVKGVPDLVVEILSPATAATDRGLKRALYERAGVPEYWIVDADERVVEQLVLVDGAYSLRGRHAEFVRPSMFPDVAVDLTKVW